MNAVTITVFDPHVFPGRQVDSRNARARGIIFCLATSITQFRTILNHLNSNGMLWKRHDGSSEQVHTRDAGCEDSSVRIVAVADVCQNVVEVNCLSYSWGDVVGQTGGEGDSGLSRYRNCRRGMGLSRYRNCRRGVSLVEETSYS
jgi:hypothetical protein